MHQSALILALSILSLVTGGKDRPAAPAVPAAEVQLASSSVALARALDAVRADQLSADVHFIASDELGGRDTPSQGLRVAARYIRARLQRLGVQPGAVDGYFHTYPLELRQLDAAGTSMVIEGRGEPRALVLGRDYFLRSPSIENAELRGGVVFTGDLEEPTNIDLKGRWALAYDGSRSMRRRGRNFEAAGAVGMIVTPGPGYDGKPYAERYASSMERLLEATYTYPSRRATGEDGEPRERFATLNLAPEAAAGLVPAGAVPGADLGFTVKSTTRRAGGQEGQVLVENVCGLWPGSDPVLRNEVIILSAHYDHVGQRADGRIFNGADDNGSGTCGLLAVAEALRAYGPMRRSVLLLWVSGEEKGLWGSRAWTETPWLPAGMRAVCDINIDMIGRNAPEKLLITPTADHEAFNGLTKLAMELAPQEGFPTLGSADDYWSRSDHRNFYVNLKIPVAFLFSDVHEDYHEETDHADKLDYDKVHRVVRLVVRMLDGLQSDELKL